MEKAFRGPSCLRGGEPAPSWAAAPRGEAEGSRAPRLDREPELMPMLEGETAERGFRTGEVGAAGRPRAVGGW